MRTCQDPGCSEPLLPFAKRYCPGCAAKRRKVCLARAQFTFYARRRAGRGVPPSRRQLLRGGTPTRWSREHPKLALKEWHRRNPNEGTPPAPLLENLVTVR